MEFEICLIGDLSSFFERRVVESYLKASGKLAESQWKGSGKLAKR